MLQKCHGLVQSATNLARVEPKTWDMIKEPSGNHNKGNRQRWPKWASPSKPTLENGSQAGSPLASDTKYNMYLSIRRKQGSIVHQIAHFSLTVLLILFFLSISSYIQGSKTAKLLL
jgi:hypothetical protein